MTQISKKLKRLLVLLLSSSNIYHSFSICKRISYADLGEGVEGIYTPYPWKIHIIPCSQLKTLDLPFPQTILSPTSQETFLINQPKLTINDYGISTFIFISSNFFIYFRMKLSVALPWIAFYFLIMFFCDCVSNLFADIFFYKTNIICIQFIK